MQITRRMKVFERNVDLDTIIKIHLGLVGITRREKFQEKCWFGYNVTKLKPKHTHKYTHTHISKYTFVEGRWRDSVLKQRFHVCDRPKRPLPDSQTHPFTSPLHPSPFDSTHFFKISSQANHKVPPTFSSQTFLLQFSIHCYNKHWVTTNHWHPSANSFMKTPGSLILIYIYMGLFVYLTRTNNHLIPKYLKLLELTVINRIKYPPNAGDP